MKLLKPVLSGTVFSAIAVAPAFADAPLFNWTGFYAGANLGGTWGRSSFTETAAGFWWVDGLSADPAGVIGGLQVGHNWQTNNLVFGLEADINFSSAKERTTISAGPPAVTHESRLTALGTLRARVGIAMDRTLVYATGGAAYAWLKSEIVDPNFPFVANRGSTTWGWTAGGGIEHAFGNNWSARAEFLHARFPDANVPAIGTYVFRFKDSVSIARVGINYRF